MQVNRYPRELRKGEELRKRDLRAGTAGEKAILHEIAGNASRNSRRETSNPSEARASHEGKDM